jgi:hypothetical protein
MNKTKEKIMSIDAGRDSIKCCWYNEGKYIKSNFSSRHGIMDFNHFKSIPILSFNPNDELKEDTLKLGDIIASIDDSNPYIIGDATDILLPPENVIYATVDEIYLEYSINYILTMVAKIAENDDDITLAINLTFNNNKFGTDLKEKLKNTHNVKFYDIKGRVVSEKSFSINKITILPQGWSSLMYKYLNEDMTENKLYEKDGILIDIGRKTVDILFNRKLNTVKGISEDLGTEYIFELISKSMFNEYNIRKNTVDIERTILNNDIIHGRKGDEIDPKKYLKEAIVNIANRIRGKIINEFGEYTPQWILLTGGGSFYFTEILKQVWTQLEVMDDPIYTNAKGMTKFLVWNLLN